MIYYFGLQHLLRIIEYLLSLRRPWCGGRMYFNMFKLQALHYDVLVWSSLCSYELLSVVNMFTITEVFETIVVGKGSQRRNQYLHKHHPQ